MTTASAILLIAFGVLAPLVARAELWRACIPAPVAGRDVLRWTAGGFALNQAIGFRSGDALRVVMVRTHCGVAAGASSVVLFRVIELAALSSCAAIAAVGYGWGGGASGVVAVALVAALLVAPRIARRFAGNALLAPLQQLDARALAKSGTLAAIAYASEAALFVGAAQLLGVSLDWSEALFLVVASTLGQVAAFLPANLGTYEASVGGALAAFGFASAALWQLPLITHAAKLALSVCLLPLFVNQPRRVTT